MAVIQHLLRRWGFVKLGRYGLVLTPDGRILSTRPAVLDDGAGGRIVGWQDGDLAMAELRPWEPARPARRSAARRAATAQAAAQQFTPAPVVQAAARQVTSPQAAQAVQAAQAAQAAHAAQAAGRHVTPPPAPGYQHAALALLPAPAYQAVISEASVLAMRPRLEPADAMAVTVAPGPTVDEDDWEWTIALARARAAAEPTDAAVSSPRPVTPRPEPAVVAPPRTRPIAAVAARDPATSGEWPKTLPIGSIDYEEYSLAATRPAVAIPRVAPPAPLPVLPRAAAPITVIPVPVLPTLQSTAQAGRLEPVVRSQVPQASPRRFPKGTGPVSPRTTSRMPAMSATAAMSDDTVPTMSVGDRTTPGIALPPAARTVQLPSITRRFPR